MEWLYTRRSGGAILLGIALFIGALCILFWRFIAAWSFQGFSQFQLYTLMALAIAYASGHFMVSSAKWSVGGVLFPIGFGGLFAVATWVCVSLSGASTSESFAMNEATASAENSKIATHKAKIAEANAERTRVKDVHEMAERLVATREAEAAAECSTGLKSRCEGRRATATTARADADRKAIQARQADADYWLLLAELDRFSAPKVANIQLRQVAKAIAFVGYNEDRVLEGLLLYLPYCFALLTEAGSILCFAYGFGANGNRPAPVSSVSTSFGDRKVEVMPYRRPWRRTRTPDEQVVLEALKRIGRPASNDELAQAMSCSKGEASKKVQVCQASGVINVGRQGRYLAITPAEA